ncbi:MAG: PRC-barrel domain containing protein [Candidatus Poseidoniales archaeon]|nr:MAG: PRC-barrel domain containing protein [Candidatus Poseidoniales archaeon]|tara:strand:+ start:4389 stop:4631 length:243 start_codon:yes stop_codon:yes gene_type:complete
MPATFTRELLAREVRDRSGDVLGHVADLIVDSRTGSVTYILVKIAQELDPAQLPWPSDGGMIPLPIDEVREIGATVLLHR